MDPRELLLPLAYVMGGSERRKSLSHVATGSPCSGLTTGHPYLAVLRVARRAVVGIVGAIIPSIVGQPPAGATGIAAQLSLDAEHGP